MAFPGEGVSHETLLPLSNNAPSGRDGFSMILDIREETVYREVRSADLCMKIRQSLC